MNFKVLFVIFLAVSMAMLNHTFSAKNQDAPNFYNHIRENTTYTMPFVGMLFSPLKYLQYEQFHFALVLLFYLAFPCFFYVFLNRLDISTIFIFLPYLWILHSALAQNTALLFFMLAFHFFRDNKPISIGFMVLTFFSHQFGGIMVLLIFVMVFTQKYLKNEGLVLKSMALAFFGYAPNTIAILHSISNEYYSLTLHFLLTLPLLAIFFIKNRIVMFNVLFFALIVASYFFTHLYSNGRGDPYAVWRIYLMFDALILFAIAETKRLEE